MPTYEYECTKCGEHFDYFQSIKEDPKSICENCGGELTKLLSGGSGLIFKGSGFYITDYKSKSGGSDSSGGENSDKSKSGDSTGKSTDSTGSKTGGESKSDSVKAKPAADSAQNKAT